MNIKPGQPVAIFFLCLSAAIARGAVAQSADQTGSHERSRFYLGAVLGSGSGETEFDGYGTVTQDMDTRLRALSLGLILRSDARFEMSFTSVSADFDDADGDDEFSGLDFSFRVPFGHHRVKPFLAAGLGFYTWEDTAWLFEDDKDLNGLAINLAGGVLIEAHRHFEFEAGYEFKSISWQRVRVLGSNQDVDITSTMGNLYVSARVKF